MPLMPSISQFQSSGHGVHRTAALLLAIACAAMGSELEVGLLQPAIQRESDGSWSLRGRLTWENNGNRPVRIFRDVQAVENDSRGSQTSLILWLAVPDFDQGFPTEIYPDVHSPFVGLLQEQFLLLAPGQSRQVEFTTRLNKQCWYLPRGRLHWRRGPGPEAFFSIGGRPSYVDACEWREVLADGVTVQAGSLPGFFPALPFYSSQGKRTDLLQEQSLKKLHFPGVAR